MKFRYGLKLAEGRKQLALAAADKPVFTSVVSILTALTYISFSPHDYAWSETRAVGAKGNRTLKTHSAINHFIAVWMA